MNKTKKKFPIFFVLFTLMYLVLEITFRTDLLNVVSTLKDIVDIESVEVVGRFIASIGFVIFLFSNFKIHIEALKKWNILVKLILYPIVFIFAFKSFYTFQEKAITFLAEEMTISEKEDALFLTLEKESLYFNKIELEGYPYTQENQNNAESKIFLALFPFLNANNENKIETLRSQQKALVANSVMGRWSNSDNLKEMIAKESEILNYIYFGFKNMDDERTRNIFPTGQGVVYDYILSNYRNIYSEAAMNYKSDKPIYRDSAVKNYYLHNKTLSRENFENKLFEDFSEAIITINLGNVKSQYSKANLLEYYANYHFYNEGHEQDKLIPYYKYKFIDMRAFALKRNQMDTLLFSDIYNGLRFNFSNCSATLSNSGGIYINNKKVQRDLTELQFDLFYNEIFDKKNVDKNTIKCRYNYENYIKTKKEMHNLFTVNNAGFYIDNINKHEITPEFVNRNFLFRKVAMYIFEYFVHENTGKYIIEYLNYDFDKYKRFEKTIDFSSKQAFIKSIKKFGADEFTILFLEKTKELGLNLNFLKNYDDHNIFYKDFYEINQVKKEIKRVFPFFVNDKNEIIKVNNVDTIDKKSIEAFKKYLIEKQYANYIEVLNNPNLMAYGEKHYELGNAISKGYIAPPLVLLISAILIFVSIINLIVKISAVFIEDKRGLLKYVMLILLFLLPLIIPNNYSGNKYIEIYKEQEPLKYYTLIWLQNSEKLISLGNIDNEFVKLYYGVFYGTALGFETTQNEDNKNIQIKLNQIRRGS